MWQVVSGIRDLSRLGIDGVSIRNLHSSSPVAKELDGGAIGFDLRKGAHHPSACGIMGLMSGGGRSKVDRVGECHGREN
ncbi:hypothetical protein BCL57_003076 [Agromyces flavus]|uniref:Uncharacterized protein n=1 Tax=Agromyces flavus TaxID=589382 RepID=A0ABT1KR13_9MICO|nr:hypothetical protein [Agromyces flavus]MCP2368897.1 hypothetical protein [Agromyces flavus]GGI48354.1 hypothetical protein GCM10010932_30420 [Agromyces flavus]